MSKAPGYMVDGNPNAKLMIIAMAPGRDELAEGRPLVGPSGKLLWRQLAKQAKISRPDTYMVNTIGEWPEGKDGPTDAQYDRWWDVFDEALSASRAKVVLVLGGDALWRVCGFYGKKHGIEDWRGYLVGREECWQLERRKYSEGVYKSGPRKGQPKSEWKSVVSAPPCPETVEWIIPTYHPSGVMRTGLKVLPVFAADLARVGRALNGTLDIKPEPWQPYFPLHVDLDGPCVFDIETGGEDNGIIERIGAVVGQGVAWTSRWDETSRYMLQGDLTASPRVAFNIAFDAPRLADAGCPVPEPWFCDMLACHVLKPDLKKSLNYVASLYMDTRRWKHLADSDPAKYNALDVVKDRDLHPIIEAELHRTGMWDMFTQRMMPTLPTLVGMTRRGLKVDPVARDAWIKQLTYELSAAFSVWQSLAGDVKTSGRNLNNFLKVEGLNLVMKADMKESSDAITMRKLLMKGKLTQRQQDIIRALMKVREITKDLKTYAETSIGGDGCVHPGYLPAGKDQDDAGKGIAGTLRISSSHPNIQNQPKSARRMYVPHQPGMVIVEADWQAIEAELLAYFADDDVLRQAIREGLHESNQRALGVDKTRAKNGFYGWSYGAGPKTLHDTFIANEYDVPIRECKELLRGFDQRFWKTARWRARIAAEVAATFHLTNPLGGRRYFMAGSGDAPKAFNFKPQSTAALLMWTVLRQIEDGLRDTASKLLATVHDSIVAECWPSELATTVGVIRSVMEQPWPELGGLVIPVSVKVGPNWGELQEYDPEASVV